MYPSTSLKWITCPPPCYVPIHPITCDTLLHVPTLTSLKWPWPIATISSNAMVFPAGFLHCRKYSQRTLLSLVSSKFECCCRRKARRSFLVAMAAAETYVMITLLTGMQAMLTQTFSPTVLSTLTFTSFSFLISCKMVLLAGFELAGFFLNGFLPFIPVPLVRSEPPFPRLRPALALDMLPTWLKR